MSALSISQKLLRGFQMAWTWKFLFSHWHSKLRDCSKCLCNGWAYQYRSKSAGRSHGFNLIHTWIAAPTRYQSPWKPA